MKRFINSIALGGVTIVCIFITNTLYSIEFTIHNNNTQKQDSFQTNPTDYFICLSEDNNNIEYISNGLKVSAQFSQKIRTVDSFGHFVSYEILFANKVYEFIKCANHTVVHFSSSDIIFPFHYFW